MNINLSRREKEILRHMLEFKLGRKEIGDRMNISESAVRQLIKGVYRKFGIKDYGGNGHEARAKLIGLFGHFEIRIVWVKHKGDCR